LLEISCFPQPRSLRLQRTILKEQVGEVDPSPENITEGDLARDTFVVLAEDPQHRDTVRSLIRGPKPERFTPMGTVAVVAAALVVLQTRVKFDRDKEGRWSLRIEKHAASDSLLKSFVSKLVSFLDGGGGEHS